MASEALAGCRILISEGNTPAIRQRMLASMSYTPSEWLACVVKRYMPAIEIDVTYSTDPDPKLGGPLESYNGIMFTGSASNIHKRDPETMRQIDFARAAFDSGTPMFGICWGLQLAAAAVGGEVVPSRSKDCSCEVPFSMGIGLTEEGRAHPLHRSRPNLFDAFGYHSDEVAGLPGGATITARNKHFIQAAIIRGSKSTFWGVQYHPELTGRTMADLLKCFAEELEHSERYHSRAQVEEAAESLSLFQEGRALPAGASAQHIPVDPRKFEFRSLEIINWLEHSVVPFVRERSMIRA